MRTPPPRSPRSTARRRWRSLPKRRTMCARTSTTAAASSSKAAGIQPWSRRWRAKAAAFIGNDCKLDGAGERAPGFLVVTGPNMAGKSTYLRQNALHRRARAGGLLRARRLGAYRRGRPAVRPHRRRRRPRARPLHLHGGDDRDGRDPQPGDAAQLRDPRRDRARHGDLRRAFHRLGGAGASARRHLLPRPRRHALSRADAARGRPAARRAMCAWR